MWAFAQSDDGTGGLGVLGSLFYLVVLVAAIAGLWKMFEKAGKPGWGSIIPIYNTILLLEMAERPLWWIIMLLIPIVNIFFGIMIYHQISRRFGKDGLFTAGLIFLAPIFTCILGFGNAEYRQLGMDA